MPKAPNAGAQERLRQALAGAAVVRAQTPNWTRRYVSNPSNYTPLSKKVEKRAQSFSKQQNKSTSTSGPRGGKKDDSGGFDLGFSPSDIVGKALEAVQFTSDVTQSGLRQVVHGEQALLGKGGPGLSWDTFTGDIGKHLTYGNVLSEALGNVDKKGYGTGEITGIAPLDFGIGIGGTVALDPLTYVAPEHWLAGGRAAVATRVGAEETVTHVAERLAAERAAQGLDEGLQVVKGRGWVKDTRLEAEQLTRDMQSRVLKDGKAALTTRDLDLVGHSGGLKFNVPFTGRVAKAARLTSRTEALQIPLLPKAVTDFLSAPARLAKNAIGDTKSAAKFREWLAGDNFALKEAIRNGGVDSFTQKRIMDKNASWAEVYDNNATKEYVKLSRKLDFKKYGKDVARAVEGDTKAAARLAAVGIDHYGLKGQLHKMALDMLEQGVSIRELDNYFPGLLTKEAKAGYAKAQALGGDGARSWITKERTNIAGKVMPDGTVLEGTNANIKDTVNRIAKEEGLGADFYERHPDKVMPVYIKAVARTLAKHRTINDLVKEGIVVNARTLTSVPIKGSAETIKAALARAGELAGKGKRLQGEAGTKNEAAAALRGDVAAGNAEIVGHAREAGAAAGRVGREAHGMVGDEQRLADILAAQQRAEAAGAKVSDAESIQRALDNAPAPPPVSVAVSKHLSDPVYTEGFAAHMPNTTAYGRQSPISAYMKRVEKTVASEGDDVAQQMFADAHRLFNVGKFGESEEKVQEVLNYMSPVVGQARATTVLSTGGESLPIKTLTDGAWYDNPHMLADVPKGHVRLFRGEPAQGLEGDFGFVGHGEGNAGKWWTPDFMYASDATGGEAGGKLYVVDVPASELDQWQGRTMADQLGDTATGEPHVMPAGEAQRIAKIQQTGETSKGYSQHEYVAPSEMTRPTVDPHTVVSALTENEDTAVADAAKFMQQHLAVDAKPTKAFRDAVKQLDRNLPGWRDASMDSTFGKRPKGWPEYPSGPTITAEGAADANEALQFGVMDRANAANINLADSIEAIKAEAGSANSDLMAVRRSLEEATLTPSKQQLLSHQEWLHERRGELLRSLVNENDPTLRRAGVLEAQGLKAQAEADGAYSAASKAQWIGEHTPTTKMMDKQIDAIHEGMYKTLTAKPGLAAPNEVADVLNAVAKVSTHEGMRGFWEHYDKLLQFIKAWQISSPGFHARNFMGGVFNNYLANMDIGAYRKFWFDERAWAKARDAGVKDGGNPLMQVLRDTLVREGQYSSHEIAAGVHTGHGLDWINPFSQKNAWLYGNRKAGAFVEHQLRGTLAYDVLRKGGKIEDAIAAVNRFHFNYADLSNVERGVKRVIPFYTWTRHNFPLQVEMIIERPGKYARYGQVKHELELHTKPEGVVPAYFSDLFAIHTGMKVGGSDVYATPDLPFTQTMAAPLPFDDNGKFSLSGPASMVTPILKVPFERAMGHQFFKDIPFTGKKTTMPHSWAVIPGFKQALQVVGMVDGQGKIKDVDAYTIESYVPFLGRARRLAPSEKKYQQRTLAAFMGFLGVPFRVNTPYEKKMEKLRRSFEGTHRISISVPNK